MAKLFENHTFAGIQRDVSVSKHPTQFLYDARNIRLTARQGDTLMTITNEKGTADTGVSVSGTYLGHCLLNQFLVVFSHDSSASYITRIDLSKATPEKKVLFSGNLKFDRPIEAIGSYESEKIQKVYWTDGKNQPRLINIAPDNDDRIERYTPTSFDFIPDLQLHEEIKVEKILGASGTFAPGVIQYAFTYYTKYGQESNIFYTTPLIYISYKERGASPEDKVENAFKIKISKIDTHFDFLRIYSIQRTSINATPICKRIQDIDISLVENSSATFIDNGTSGDSIDPTELLYKGGEPITAETIEQKDNTLFLGNIKLDRPNLNKIKDTIKNGVRIVEDLRIFNPTLVSKGSYTYYNQLTSYADGTKDSVPCAGFKFGDYYRLGVQFQHKSGRWSDPVYIENKQMQVTRPADIGSAVSVPIFKGSLTSGLLNALKDTDYRKVRAVVVYPGMQDRYVVCQGVANPTVYTEESRNTNKNVYAQSSWFFRPECSSFIDINKVNVSPTTGTTEAGHWNYLEYANRGVGEEIEGMPTKAYNPSNLRQVEIQGDFDDNHKFKVDTGIVTLHSPDVQFDDALAVMDFTGLQYRKVGDAVFTHTMSDIDIQTETPTVSNNGSGFVHKAFTNDNGPYGIVSGLFYDDYLVDDDFQENGMPGAYPIQKASCKFLVYPWNKTGSLNNDMNRPSDKGTITATLKKKVISNLRYAKTEPSELSGLMDFSESRNPQLFSSNEMEILKMGSDIYQGNVDTSLIPDYADGVYFAWEGGKVVIVNDDHQTVCSPNITPFNSEKWFKTFSKDPNIQNAQGVREWWDFEDKWEYGGGDIGNQFIDLVMKKDNVRMKYKSTPHIIMEMSSTSPFIPATNGLNIVELVKKDFSTETIFGGESQDALRENIWIPCGEPVSLYNDDNTLKSSVSFLYEWGDTYYQRYDCLKTYPFTREDVNQIVEIGSFMLETHTNIDGRYDRNRGQSNNLNMSPTNFNLLNPVYSQINNFFQYRIQDNDYYKNNQFPNQITWTKGKTSGADVDMWTNITLASVYDMDGSKGAVTSINVWKDLLFCFQTKGVSNILFNSRVQIPASDGVPIEISNSYKVDGYRYISDGIGCNDKLQIKEATSGIYFIDSISGHLHHVGEGIRDVAAGSNMTTWFRENGKDTKRLFYDDINHDLYVVMEDTALCFSELLSQFTSFMDYGSTSLIESYNHRVFTMKDSRLWKMFEGDHCKFFEVNKPWGLTFISNGSGQAQTDKIFTNLEFRACVSGDGTYDASTGKFTPFLPFDYLETWDEYQHGFANLSIGNGHSASQHHHESGDASLIRKFRIWRCDIPRNNAAIDTDKGLPGLSRHIRKPNDRMRNPWLYVKLQKNAAESGTSLPKTEIHDIVMTYFG